MDAAHFVHGAIRWCICCVVQRFVPTGNGRQWLSLLGAVDAVSHRLFAITTRDNVNALTVTELLPRIAATNSGPITIVLDNARYQRCKHIVQVAAELRNLVLFLPSCSRNLNLIQRFWKYMKAHCLHSGYHAHFDDMFHAVNRFIHDAQ